LTKRNVDKTEAQMTPDDVQVSKDTWQSLVVRRRHVDKSDGTGGIFMDTCCCEWQVGEWEQLKL